MITFLDSSAESMTFLFDMLDVGVVLAVVFGFWWLVYKFFSWSSLDSILAPAREYVFLFPKNDFGTIADIVRTKGVAIPVVLVLLFAGWGHFAEPQSGMGFGTLLLDVGIAAVLSWIICKRFLTLWTKLAGIGILATFVILGLFRFQCVQEWHAALLKRFSGM